MATIPVKVQNRFQEGLKKYKKILTKAQSQDINESDTVTIITDVLQDIFGYVCTFRDRKPVFHKI